MIQKFFIKKATKELPLQVGEKYRDVVLGCLTGHVQIDSDTTDDLGFQHAFRTNVVGVLEQAALNV